MCNQEPPTTDLDALDILCQTLRGLGGYDATMRTLWEKAAKARPRDLDVQMRWFTNAFEDGDWKSAQKVRFLIQSALYYAYRLSFSIIYS